jgi:hypothetical protein
VLPSFEIAALALGGRAKGAPQSCQVRAAKPLLKGFGARKLGSGLDGIKQRA